MVANVLRTVLMALAGLLMVPYYIGEFGLATYAILPLATTVTNYFVMISDSLSNAFSRYMSISVQAGDPERLNTVFSSSVIGMAKCMGLMFPIAILVSILAPYVFHVGPSAYADVQIMFFLIMLASMIISFGASLGGVYMAYNSLYITYFSGASLIYGGLTALCLIMLWLYFCMIILLSGAEINKLFFAGTRQNRQPSTQTLPENTPSNDA